MPVIFNEKSSRFRDERGRFISGRKVRGSIEKAGSVLEKDLRSIAKDFNKGKINLAEFQIQFAEKIKSAHIFAAAVGRGGREQMTVKDWGKVGSDIREQYKFLNRFARAIEAGKLSANQIEYRASLYSKAPRANYFKNEKEIKIAAGFGFARRILHAMESCSECASWASRGYVPIEQQPPIGALLCKSFCKCDIEYSEFKPEDAKGNKAKGFFFVNEEVYPYEPENESIGQAERFSCVPVVARMLLKDNQKDLPEVFVRNALETDEAGTRLSSIVPLLNEEVGKPKYIFQRKTDFENLREAVERGSAAVNVRISRDVHSLIVDKIENGKVYLRDPLPIGKGAAYAVAEETFLKYWLIPEKNYGISVIIDKDD